MIRSCLLGFVVVASAACAGPKPVAQPVPPAPSTAPDAPAPAETAPPAAAPTPPAQPPATPQVAATTVAHCLYVDPDHRVVRCYWTREDCEQQMAFNKGLVAGNQTCEAATEVHCFDENGKNQLCYPTAADCDAMVAKMKQRKRPASQCAAKRGP